MVAVGSQQPESWHVKPQPMDFFDFKGEIEEILAAGRVKVEYVRSERAWLHPGQSAEILVDGQSIGYLGRLHPSLENELDLSTTWLLNLIKLPFCNLMYLILQNYHVFLRSDVILRF